MPEFLWQEHPKEGVCSACGDAQCAGGFVNFLSDSFVHVPSDPSQGRYGDVAGIVDVTFCSNCVQQAVRLVGGLGAQDTLDLQLDSLALQEEIDRLKDELQAQQQRFDNLVEGAAGYKDGFRAALSNVKKADTADTKGAK
jgi:hypothetical protein